MTAKISRGANVAASFENQITLGRYGQQGAGKVFIDRDGDTFIGTINSTGMQKVLKLVSISPHGYAYRLGPVSWPVRLAPKDHVVTFQNEE